MNEIESAIYVSTYNPDCVDVHSDSSDFDLEDNSDVKTKKKSRRREKRYREIRLIKHNSQTSQSSLYFDVINSVELKNRNKINVTKMELDYDQFNVCKERKVKNIYNNIYVDGELIDDSGRSQNKRIDNHVRCGSKTAEQYFLYDTNNLNTKSYTLTNKTPNNICSSGNYYINSENKRPDHDNNKNIRPHIYRVDNKYTDHNKHSKSKRIDRFVNKEKSSRIENHSPNYRKVIDNRFRRQDNWADDYIHCEDNRVNNYYNHIENNTTDNYCKSIRPDGYYCSENNWPENKRKFNSPIRLSNRAQAQEMIQENKNKLKRHKVNEEKEVLHSSSSRWPLLKQKCMPHLYNILERFGSSTKEQKNTCDKRNRCSPLEDVTLLHCSKCKTTRTTNNPVQVVQSIHTLNGNTQNCTPFDKMKYTQHGTARVLQAADIDTNPLQNRCSNCSLSSTSGSEIMNEKIRQKLEKRFKKKIKKYLYQQIKKRSTKEKLRPYPYQNITYASMDVKTSPRSGSSHFLDSIFRDINKKYEEKQTENIGDSNRKNPNIDTLNARVGGSDYVDETVAYCSSNCHMSNSNLSQDNVSRSGKYKQQQIRHSARVDSIVGFECQCIKRRGDNTCVTNKQPTRMSPMYHPPVPMQRAARKHTVPSKVECACKKKRYRNQGQSARSNNYHRPPQYGADPPPPSPYPPSQYPPSQYPPSPYPPSQYPPSQNPPSQKPPSQYPPSPQPPSPPPASPPPSPGGPRPKQGGLESCELCCQQPHDKLLQDLKRQYKGEIVCIHNPPCVLINGCLNLPPNTGRNQYTTAVYSAPHADRTPLLRNKSVNPGLGNNMKISNICENCVKNRTSYLPRGQTSNNIRRKTQGINTCKPCLFDKSLNETNTYLSKLEDSPKLVPNFLETQSIQVQMSTNKMKAEDNIKIKPDNSEIPKIVNHPTIPLVNTTTQVRCRYSTFCHNTRGTQCLSKPDYTSPQLSQDLNSELPICLMNYSDFPVIKENASAQVTPEVDPKLENYCVHVPICRKLRNCKVDTENIDEISTMQWYESQTSNMNLISLTVKETFSTQTTGQNSMKSFSILKYMSNKSSCKKSQKDKTLKIPDMENHYVALTAVNEISTQIREWKRNLKCRRKPEREVLSNEDTASRKVREKQRQLTCRHYPRCINVHKCVGKLLQDSIIAYKDLPICSHKRCCELIPACYARNVKNVKNVSCQRPPNTCHII